MIITLREAERILKCKTGELSVSLDLGLTMTKVKVEKDCFIIGDERIPLSELETVKEDACYVLGKDHAVKIAYFSHQTNFYYKLVPSTDWPTITLSSTPMHRHTKISPKQDTLFKVGSVQPITGKVLDTCCGLGYTAIMASKKASEVYSYEKDETVLHIAKLNPYSKALFGNPKIKLINDNVFTAIAGFPDKYFNCIIHDPPTFKYASELYSGAFYSELYRVLKMGGRLYHYIPKPQKMKNKHFHTGVIRRLQDAGFKARYDEKASGAVCVK